MNNYIYKVSSKNLLYSIRKYIQYHVITYNGKEPEKEYICIRVYILIKELYVYMSDRITLL